MSEHPIHGLMTTAMQSIKEMVDVNTIVGDAVQAPDGTVIIPVSKVTFGFAAGGSEFKGSITSQSSETVGDTQRMPFGGGNGAGVSIIPMAFLVVNQDNIKLLPVNTNTSLDRVLEAIPEIVEKFDESIKKSISIRKEEKKESKKKKEIE